MTNVIWGLANIAADSLPLKNLLIEIDNFDGIITNIFKKLGEEISLDLLEETIWLVSNLTHGIN